MKVKLDENLGTRTAALFRDAGHDVSTVTQQELCGVSDDRLYAVCAAEGRVIVTLDLDFANPYRYDPAHTAGIAVLRVPTLPNASHLGATARTLLAHAADRSIHGRLWVVTEGRVRQYEPRGD